MKNFGYDPRPMGCSPARLTPTSLKRIKAIYDAQRDPSRPEDWLKRQSVQREVADPHRRAKEGRAFDGSSSQNGSDTNADGNLRKLKRRIKKLSRRVVEAEKHKLVKLYGGGPVEVAKAVERSRPPVAPVDIVEELRRIRLEKDKKKVEEPRASRGKKRRKRKKALGDRERNGSTSSTSVQSCNSVAFHSDLPKARKPDILRMIKEKESFMTHAGDESDVSDSDVSHRTLLAFSGTKLQAAATSQAFVDKKQPQPPARFGRAPNPTGPVRRASSRSSLASSAPSSAASFRTIPLKERLRAQDDARYATCVASLANILGGLVENDDGRPPSVSVPEYLEQIRTSRVKASRKKAAKRNTKMPADGAKVSKEKLIEEPKSAKSVLKKVTASKRKDRKEHVLFTESPEVIPGKENTTVLKHVLEESAKKLRRLKKKSKKEPPTTPSASAEGDVPQLTEPHQKNAKLKTQPARKQLSIDIPLGKVAIDEDLVLAKNAKPPVPKPATPMARQLPEEPRQANPSVDACRKLQKQNTDTLVNLNAQMSDTLQQSIAHLNDICMRVRSTLSDMERDQITYNQKRRVSDLGSETGSNADIEALISVVSVHTEGSEQGFPNNDEVNLIAVEPPPPPAPYTIIKPIQKDEGLDRILTSISMQGGDLGLDEVKEKEKEKRRKKRMKKVKREKEADSREVKDKPVERSSMALLDLPPPHRIPIWERKPPSVINDIQLMVKRQATRSQYKEFMRNLRRARRSSSTTVAVPSNHSVKRSLDVLQTGNSPVKQTNKQVKSRDTIDTPDKTRSKRCTACCSERCTCGVVVENVHPASSTQKMQWIKTRSAIARRGIQAYDILDEITLKDLEPLQSEYPRKDHIVSEESNTKIEDTLLYRLLYNESPQVLESLLRSTNESSSTSVKPSPFTLPMKKETAERPNLVSQAYQMYEKLELGSDQPPKSDSVNNNSDSLDFTPPKIASIGPIKAVIDRLRIHKMKERKPAQNCLKEFDDKVNIPADLVQTVSLDARRKSIMAQRQRSSRVCTIDLLPDLDIGDGAKKGDEKKTVKKAKKTGHGNAKKKTKQHRKDYINPKLKQYLIDPKSMHFQNILTVLRVSVVSCTKIPKVEEIAAAKRDRRFPTSAVPFADPNLEIAEENRAKIASMSKREVVRKLAPYIFMDLRPRVITVMPVFTTKFPHQPQPVSHYPMATASRMRATSERGGTIVSPQTRINPIPTVTSLHRERSVSRKRACRDHGDSSSAALRKFCNRCQQMQSMIHDHPLHHQHAMASSTRVPPKRNAPTGDMNTIRKLTSTSRVSPNSSALSRRPSAAAAANVGNDAAVLTRKKLNEVKSLVNQNREYFPKNLNRAIENIEFKIVDVFSNPVSKHSDAFLQIEEEIKSILTNIAGEPAAKGPGKKAQPAKSKFVKPKHLSPNTTSPSTTSKSSNGSFLAEPEAVVKDVFPRTDSFTLEEVAIPPPVSRKSETGSEEEAAEKLETSTELLGFPQFELEEEEEKIVLTEPDKDDDVLEMNFSIGPLTDDIEKAIQGLDALMNIESSDISRIESNVVTEVSLTESTRGVPVECKTAVTTFCAQVDKVINQINAVQHTEAVTGPTTAPNTEQSNNERTVPSDHNQEVEVLTFRSDDYLTPYMKAVKDYRCTEHSESLMDFLDKLSSLSSHDKFASMEAVSLDEEPIEERAPVIHDLSVADIIKPLMAQDTLPTNETKEIIIPAEKKSVALLEATSSVTYPLKNHLSVILSNDNSTEPTESQVEVNEEVLLSAKEGTSKESSELKECLSPTTIAVSITTDPPPPQQPEKIIVESSNNYCQATGLQDISQQIDLDHMVDEEVMCNSLEEKEVVDSASAEFEETVKLSISTSNPLINNEEQAEESYININMQTMPTSEVFNEVEEYVRNFNLSGGDMQSNEDITSSKKAELGAEEVIKESVRKQEELLQEDIRQEVLKRDILMLEIEHEKLLLQDTQQQISTSSVKDVDEEEEEEEDDDDNDQSNYFEGTLSVINLPSIAAFDNPFELLDNETQAPSDDGHECFVQTATADVQASIELKDSTTNTNCEWRKRDLTFNSFAAAICSSVDVAKPLMVSVSTETVDGVFAEMPRFEKATSIDTFGAVTESGSGLGPDPSPRVDETHTDTCLVGGTDKKFGAAEMPLVKNTLSLDLISLFDATRRKSEATNAESTTTATESANQLLQAISQFLAETDIGGRQWQREEPINVTTGGDGGDGNASDSTDRSSDTKKAERDETGAPPAAIEAIREPPLRHGTLLNSIYGLLFTVVFLGLNMNYTC